MNKNLTKNKDEFSWNLKGLLYVLVTADQDLSTLQIKTYSNNFSKAEWMAINEICSLLVKKYLHQLNQDLTKMELVENCSESFKMAKNLLKSYFNLLTTECIFHVD